MRLGVGSLGADAEGRALWTVSSYVPSHDFSRIPLTCSLFLLVLSVVTMAAAVLGAEHIHGK